jgi:hypothetical protein
MVEKMPTYIGINKNGLKYYKNALSPREIKEAEDFRIELESSLSKLESELNQKFKENSLEYKHQIGVFLVKKIKEKGIPDFEVQYLIEMIKSWVPSKINTGKDSRGKTRFYYNYCIQLSKFDIDTVLSFTWRHWSELIDRSITLKDSRFIYWLKKVIHEISNSEFRMFLVGINLYLQNHDTTILNDDEIALKYDVFLKLVKIWSEYHNSKKSKAFKRLKDTTKNRKKFLEISYKNIKFRDISEIDEIGFETINNLSKHKFDHTD